MKHPMPDALAKAIPQYRRQPAVAEVATIKLNWTLTNEERLGRENPVPEHLAGVPSALPEGRHDDVDYEQRGTL